MGLVGKLFKPSTGTGKPKIDAFKLLLLKPAAQAQVGKDKIVYKLLTQSHKHPTKKNRKNKLREATND